MSCTVRTKSIMHKSCVMLLACIMHNDGLM